MQRQYRVPIKSRIMKILAYSLAVVFLVAIGAYYAFFFNPQSGAQEELNAAWRQFGEDVASLAKVVENAPFNQDEQTAAEGYRHISRYLATFLAEYTDYRDPEYPQFARLPNMVARIGWDNPDNLYLSFPVRGDHVYQLHGDLSHFDLVTINVYSGMLGHTPILDIRTISSVVSDDLETNENGHFLLTLSAEPAKGNWLKLEPDAYIVIVRRLVSDWQKTDEGMWEVLNLTTLGQGAPRPTPRRIREDLDHAVSQVESLRELFTLAHRATFQLALDPNEISEPAVTDPNIPMADPFQAASRGYFKLQEHEALVIEAPVTDCRYSSIQLANPWMESLDYASRQTNLNHANTHVDGDGRIRYVISHSDPGISNWLDTAGWNEGSFCLRWTLCSVYPTDVSSRLIKLEQLDSNLPVNTPRVSPAERRQTLADRQASISRRYAGGS